MRYLLTILVGVLTVTVVEAQILPLLGEDRVGISAMTALKLPPDARGAAMAGAVTATAFDASAAFWNPALLTDVPNGALFSSSTAVGSAEHLFAAALYALDDDNHLAVAALRYGVPDMDVTTETQPFGTGERFQARDLAASISYARRFTEQFSAGVTLRLADESLAGFSARTVLVDAGTLYRTGLGSLRFAVAVQNFGGEVTPTSSVDADESLESFYPPTVFTIGFAYDLIDDTVNVVTLGLALNHPNDNSENFSLGGEYQLRPFPASPAAIAIRGGVRVNADDEELSLGAGLRLPAFSGVSLRLDYALVAYDRLGTTHRISAGVDL